MQWEPMFTAAAKERQREAGKTHGKGQAKVVVDPSQPINGRKCRDDAAAAVGGSASTADSESAI